MNDPYFSTCRCVYRLVDTYRKHGNLIIGFDFDDTVYDFHGDGHFYPDVINILRKCKTMGLTLVLWTAKNENDTHNAVQYCISRGIKPDYINESPVMNDTKKPYLNLLLDDKAGLQQSYEILAQTLTEISVVKAV